MDGDAQGNSGWLISGHDKFRFGYGNLGKVRSENLENLKFWKVVRMRHAIVENDGMPRGILFKGRFSLICHIGQKLSLIHI